MGLILDSSVLVTAEREGQNARQTLEAIASRAGNTEIGISVVTLIELAHGAARADTPQRKAKRQQFIQELLVAGCPILLFATGWESRWPLVLLKLKLPPHRIFCKVELMEVPFTPDVQAKLDQMARDTGRSSDELVQDAVIGFFDELAFTRDLLERRYRDLESGRVQPIDGEEAYRRLMAKTEERRRHSAK